MRSRTLVQLLLVAPLVGLPACDALTDPRPGAQAIELPRALTAEERAVVGAGNTFAFDLISQVPLDDPASPNVFLSPLSASMSLGMAMNGAGGETWSQMREALGFRDLDEPAINQAYHDLIELLRELDPKVEFGLGNSVWAREGIPFHEDFLDRTRRWFDAHVEALDFADPASLDIMNGWVEDRTNGRIRELIDAISDDAIMYLINAVYFNGDWLYEFDEEETSRRPFTRADGTAVEVDMMAMEADLRFFIDEGGGVLELPYGGRAYSAIAALPARDQSLAEMVTGLDAATWADWMSRLEAVEPTAVGVMLPKLEIRYDRLLNDDLQALGMQSAFNLGGAADFSRMTPLGEPGDVYLSRVQQKSFLKVDERGTEAAAATFTEVVIICSGCGGGPALVFDRPFLFAIRERLSGTILFIGVIGDPSV